jgi:hypothetical protein
MRTFGLRDADAAVEGSHKLLHKNILLEPPRRGFSFRSAVQDPMQAPGSDGVG